MTAPLTQTTGRRKEAVARVRLRAGTGEITVNKRAFDDYFTSSSHRLLVTEALRITETDQAFDVDATLDGGGVAGQAGALRLGIARALVDIDPEIAVERLVRFRGMDETDARNRIASQLSREATTVAVRGPPSMNDCSPTRAYGSIVATTR